MPKRAEPEPNRSKEPTRAHESPDLTWRGTEGWRFVLRLRNIPQLIMKVN